MIFVLFVLSFVFSVSSRVASINHNQPALPKDVICREAPASKPRMKEVNQAKMNALGNHACIDIYIKFENNTVAYTTSFPTKVNSYYDRETGALHSDYTPVGSNVTTGIDEYAEEGDSACIEIDDAPNSGYYTQSIDQNKGGLGTSWRAIGYYTPDYKKKIKGTQILVPTKYGDVLSLVWLDANDKLDYAVFQTCFTL